MLMNVARHSRNSRPPFMRNLSLSLSLFLSLVHCRNESVFGKGENEEGEVVIHERVCVRARAAQLLLKGTDGATG